MQTERTSLQFAAFHVFLKESKHILILIILVSANIKDEVQIIWYHVVLRATLYLRHRHLCRP